MSTQTTEQSHGFHHHAIEDCTGYCPFHNPSEHLMLDWPIQLRETGLMERRCEHGIGHPDPDSAAYFEFVTHDESWGIHGCDGCCSGQFFG